MPDEPRNKPALPQPDAKDIPPAGPEPGTPPPTQELTPEEQMARFEDALKEEDWGHQPC